MKGDFKEKLFPESSLKENFFPESSSKETLHTESSPLAQNNLNVIKQKLMLFLIKSLPIETVNPLTTSDYLFAFFTGLSALWLYYDNVDPDSAADILTDVMSVLVANFFVADYAALELAQRSRATIVPKNAFEEQKKYLKYFPPRNRKKLFIEILGAALAAIPFGASALQTGNETGALKVTKGLLTWFVNGVINTIPMEIILNQPKLRNLLLSPVLLPYLGYRKARSLCCSPAIDAIEQKQKQLDALYNQLRQSVRANMEKTKKRILALPDEKISDYLDTLADTNDRYATIKELLSPEEKNVSLHEVKNPKCASTRLTVSTGIQTYSPYLVFMIALIIGIIMELGDVGFTMETANDFSDQMNLSRTGKQFFTTWFSSTAVIPLTVLTCYFNSGTILKATEFVSDAISPISIKSFAMRYYRQVKLALCILALYVGYFSSAAGVEMYTGIMKSDSLTAWGEDHFGSSWSSIADAFINITKVGIKIFNTFSMLELIDSGIQAFALKFNHGEAKAYAQLTNFWDRFMSIFEQINNPGLLSAVDSITYKDRKYFTGIPSGEYSVLRGSIINLTTELEELKQKPTSKCCGVRIFDSPDRKQTNPTSPEGETFAVKIELSLNSERSIPSVISPNQ